MAGIDLLILQLTTILGEMHTALLQNQPFPQINRNIWKNAF